MLVDDIAYIIPGCRNRTSCMRGWPGRAPPCRLRRAKNKAIEIGYLQFCVINRTDDCIHAAANLIHGWNYTNVGQFRDFILASGDPFH